MTPQRVKRLQNRAKNKIKHARIQRQPSTAIQSPPRKSTVNDVFTFNASAICAAPPVAMRLSVVLATKQMPTWSKYLK